MTSSRSDPRRIGRRAGLAPRFSGRTAPHGRGEKPSAWGVGTAALISLFLCAFGPPVLGQDSDLVTDRPDQTESAVTVAPGQFQIETGVLLTRSDSSSGDLETAEILGTLVRIGLTERVELRVGFDGLISQSFDRRGSPSRRSEGLGDAAVGAKILWLEEGQGKPQAAVLVESSVPIGGGEVTSDDYEPSVRLALAKTLSDRVSLGWNAGLSFPGGEEIAFYTLAAGVGLDDTNGIFIEVFGESDGQTSLDAGWTYLVRPTVQFDVAVGAGLSDAAPDWFVGLGVSIRVPN